jgi:hypothetical protein
MSEFPRFKFKRIDQEQIPTVRPSRPASLPEPTPNPAIQPVPPSLWELVRDLMSAEADEALDRPPSSPRRKERGRRDH